MKIKKKIIGFKINFKQYFKNLCKKTAKFLLHKWFLIKKIIDKIQCNLVILINQIQNKIKIKKKLIINSITKI